MVINCPHCGIECKTKRGLTQHIYQVPQCLEKEQANLGVQARQRPQKRAPPKRPGFEGGELPSFVPRKQPFVGRNQSLDGGSQCLPARKWPAEPFETGRHGRHDLLESPKQLLQMELDDFLAWGKLGQIPRETRPYQRKPQPTHANQQHEAQTLDRDDVEDMLPADDNESSTNDDEMAIQDDETHVLNEHVVAGEADFNNDGVLNVHVDTTMLASFQEYCWSFKKTFLPELSDAQKRGVRLMDILRRKRAPMDTFDEVMLWHFRENGELDDDERLKDAKGCGYISRQKLIADLKERYNLKDKFPVKKPLTLPFCKAKVELVCHSAWGALESLLTDPRVTDDDFWFFDDDPFAEPPETVHLIGDLQTGEACRAAYKQYKKTPNQIPLPIPMYIDGAQTAQMKSMPITALKMTLGLFTRTYRDKDQAWRILGHVASVSKHQSRAKKLLKKSKHIDGGCVILDDEEGDDSKNDPAGPPQDLHAMLDVILESFLEVQKKGFMWDLRYRGKTYKNVEFIPYVIFVKCDTQEADLLCGSYTSRGMGVKQLCRYCVCPTNDSDNPQALYPRKLVSMVKAYTDAKDLVALKDMSQQCIQNAFYKVRFSPVGDAPLGIHGACASEMLHAVLLGNFAMIRDTLYEQVGKESLLAGELDSISQLFGRQFARQSERDMPKCTFTNGIREGKLNAKEYRGILLVMATIFRSKLGRDTLGTNKTFGKQKLNDWAYLCELVLCWEAFLCQEEMTKFHALRLAAKNRFIFWLIKKVANRKTGMGLKLMKIHAITHICADIIVNGVPLEVDTGSNESGHKETKAAANMTQKNERLFDFQTGTRIDEFLLIDLAKEEMDGRKLWEYFENPAKPGEIPSPPPEEQYTGGTRINIFWDSNNNKPCYSLGTGRQSKDPEQHEWDRDVLVFLHQLQDKVAKWIPKLEVRGEHKRQGLIFRGHPMYRGGVWRDWVLVDWGGDEPEPAEVWCFVVLKGLPKLKSQKKNRRKKTKTPTLHHGHCALEDGVFAVVECANFLPATNNIATSLIFWKLEKTLGCHGTGVARGRKFFLVDVNAIADPCLVVPDVGSQNGCTYFQVKSRSNWVLAFEDWMLLPYPETYLNDRKGRAFED